MDKNYAGLTAGGGLGRRSRLRFDRIEMGVNVMRDESIGLLDAIGAYNLAHEGESDDVEIDAAFATEDAALRLLQRVATVEPDVAKRLEDFDSALRASRDAGCPTSRF
jgi:hypothetical protein